MKIDFSNKTVIVTGGTRGIGAAIVELFQQCNAQVIGTGTNTKELERLNQFPDDHTIEATDNKRAFFMGNALVVGVVKKLSKSLADSLK